MSVALAVWEVVAEVGAVDTDGLPIGQNSNIVPDNFFVTEGWPAVVGALNKEILWRSSDWGAVEGFASDAVVEGSGRRVLCKILLNLIDPPFM